MEYIEYLYKICYQASREVYKMVQKMQKFVSK
jgi:hypothetical protein